MLFQRINPRRYLFLSLSATLLCFLLVDNAVERTAVVVVYMATLINQWMLLGVCHQIASKGITPVNTRLVALFLGKLVVLMAGILLGVHLSGKKIIIPLANYIIHIFILYSTFKDSK